MRKFLACMLLLGSFHSFSQTPTVTSVTPASGNTGTTVTILGTGFNSSINGNKVFIGSSTATVVSAMTTQLVVTVPAAASGSGKIKIVNTVSKRSIVSDKEFTTTFNGGIATGANINTQYPGANIFAGPNIEEGTQNYSGFKTTAADFDGDGRIDMASMAKAADKSMTVYRNVSAEGKALMSSSFISAATLVLETNSYTTPPVSEDINNDGKPDILVSHAAGFTLFINQSTGAGDITFAKQNILPSGTSFSSYKSILADLDKDGWLDIVAINPGNANKIMSMYRNTSTASAVSFSLAAVNRTFEASIGDVLAADIDNDGDKDLVVSSADRPYNQAIYYVRNTNTTAGTISFSTTPTTIDNTLPQGSYTGKPVGLAAADLDDDGDIDIVGVAKGTSGGSQMLVHLYRNDGSSTFTRFVLNDFTSQSNITYSVRIADVNGDGKKDILFGKQNGGGIAVLLNKKGAGAMDAGSFELPSHFTFNSTIMSLLVEDFNNDGRVDILGTIYYFAKFFTLTNGAAVYFPKGTSSLQSTANWNTSEDGTGTAPGNFGSGKEFYLSAASGAASYTFSGSWNMGGRLTIPAGKTLNMQYGDLTVSGELENNGTIAGTTSVYMSGAVAQSLKGSGDYPHLVIANSAGVSLSANITVKGNLQLNTGNLNIGAHTLTLQGRLTRVGGTLNAAQGTLALNGSTLQAVPASAVSNTVHSLIVNNTAGVEWNNASTIDHLSLANGILNIGTNDLTVGSLSGGSASSFVRSAGGLLKQVASQSATVFFPVGNSAYNPLAITNNTGMADEFSVSVLDDVYANGSHGAPATDPRVKRTWNIHKANPNTGAGVDFVFHWNEGEADRVTAPRLYHHDGNAWKKQSGPTSATSNSLSYTGYTGSFSPFAIGDDLFILPVRWQSFTATAVKEGVKLDWQTAGEEQARHFTVQHSVNGNQWTDLGTVAAAGNTNALRSYGYVHASPVAGPNHYRIRQTDLDGQTSFSAIKAVQVRQAGNDFRIKNNPVVNKMLQMDLKKASAVYLYNSDGRLLLQQFFEAGRQQVSLDHLPAGVYILATAGQTERILVQ